MLELNKLYLGKCEEVLKGVSDNSIDSIVTDPPYGIRFMNKKWDYQIPSVEIWKEILRVLKPGGHLLAFGGTRTYHRTVCNIEDAGFEIRDQIQWIYGSGMPKSFNIGRGIDEVFGVHKWSGWGTALKPAYEPIVLARKPLSEKTIIKNVMRWGVGGINIDECRVKGPEPHHNYGRTSGEKSFMGKGPVSVTPKSGRWPSNVIHDGSEEVLDLFEEFGTDKGQAGNVKGTEPSHCHKNDYSYRKRTSFEKRDDSGSAARFYYCAKASPSERGSFNDHPTVKPITLLKYLITLITPKGGKVLDPFIGSGSTALAAIELGFDWIGIEEDEETYGIAEKRIELKNGKETI